MPAVLLVLAVAAAAFVLGPLRRPEAAPADDPETGRLLRARDAAYRALRDLETDRATGKIGEADYAAMRQRFEADAVAALHRLDALTGRAPDGAVGERQPGGDGSA
jgi:hypothetical protein